MASRTWKVEELKEIADELQRNCWFRGRTAELYAELRAEMESLVKCIYSHVDARERMKFYAARRCWKVRDERTPSDAETWGQWFERLHGEPLTQYAMRAAKDGIRQKVLEYELATYGQSPLEKEIKQQVAA